MLEFYKFSNPDIIFNFIENHELDSATWIVSDLKSKNEIQKFLLQQQGFFLETSILRASDFWKIGLRRLAPQVQIVATDFIKILVGNFVAKHGSGLEIKEYEIPTLHAYLFELAPVLLHSHSDNILADWFGEHKKIKKWHRWYLLAKACMKFIINEHQVIDHQWVAAFIQNLDLQQLNWQKPLIVDLGSEMSSVELGLFKLLSQKTDVKILWPQPLWHQQFPFLLKTYQDSSGYGSVKNLTNTEEFKNLESLSPKTVKNLFIRVSTQLAEVKYAVAKVHQWVDAGVLLSDIAIVASDIDKTYWPVLKFFLDEEGMIYQKDDVIKLNSLGQIQSFTAYCTNLMSEVAWDSLETTFFSKTQAVEFTFENFKALFYQLYDESDLIRNDEVKNLFFKKLDLTAGITRTAFLVEVVKIWSLTVQAADLSRPNDQNTPNYQFDLFEIIFKDFLSKSVDTTATFKNWFNFLQSCINSKEIKINNSTQDGLQILSLMSSHLSQAKFQIFLGSDEKSLSTNKKNLIPTTDIFELKTKFDFAIEYPDESFYDFNIRWLAERNDQEKIYLCANASFEAEPLMPSLFFLENNSCNDLTIPQLTRHDQVQGQHVFNSVKGIFTNEGLKRDVSPTTNTVAISPFAALSAGDIEEYWACHFKLLAQKVFKLRDLPQTAVDLDPRQKGSLLHMLFDHLINPSSPISAEDFLEEKRTTMKIYYKDDLIWHIHKTKLLQIGKQFLVFEETRKNATTVATEAAFEMVFDTEKKEFVSLSQPAGASENRFITIKGRIDRVDNLLEAKNNTAGLVVYDYKSSTADLKNYNDWLKEGEFQLLLYLIACEKYLFKGQSVMAAVYYDYRRFEAKKGLVNSVYQNLFFPEKRLTKNFADEEAKNLLIGQFSEVLSLLLSELANFDFTAKPVDSKICNQCNWSKLCRAPHLM